MCKKETDTMTSIPDNPLAAPEAAFPPFDRIRVSHYLPAFRESMAEAQAEWDRIAADPEPPSFGNTIAAIDRAGRWFAYVSDLFFNLLEADASEAMREAASEIVPLVTAHENAFYLHEGLFRRVEAALAQPEPLNGAQRMLARKMYDGFVRHGALLQGEERERFSSLRRSLSQLCLTYKNNVLAATTAFELYFSAEREEALSGIPDTEKQIAAERALRKGHADGWLFDLSQPSYTAFMKHAAHRGYRKKLYEAYQSRALGGANDNAPIVRGMVNLRLEMAQMLGYATYADYVLDDRMLKTTAEVNALLRQLLEAYRPIAEKEMAVISDFAAKEGLEGGMQPWDWAYYQSRYQERECRFDEQLLRPYFPLEKVREGVFALAGRLYGLGFRRREDVPVYHPEVEVYEVSEADGTPLAFVYMDYFPRESKRGGAWMTSFRETCRGTDGKRVLPLVSLVFNFTPATADQPALLSFREVETFLHEFGHALHGMLSQADYVSLAGTSVVRDFVELPSQIMENWAQEPAFLDLFAKHYRTGEALPEEWVRKIKEQQRFCEGYFCLRQLNFGLLDMAWHTLSSPFEGDVEAFEDKATLPARLLPRVPHTAISTAFTHIFGGGYAAGYYAYKWSEVLSDDAYESFAQEGVFNRETASRFREHILSKGGTADAMELYVRFKGRKPSLDAMLHKH